MLATHAGGNMTDTLAVDERWELAAGKAQTGTDAREHRDRRGRELSADAPPS